MTIPEGDIYEGYWIDDKANGHGVFVKFDGSKFQGVFENDK